MSEPTDTWLDPEREPEVLARIDQIESDFSGFCDSADVLWLANLARQLIALRIATRASVAANARRVRDLERVQRDEDVGELSAIHYPDERGSIRSITFIGRKGSFMFDELTFPMDAKAEWIPIAIPTP